MRILLTGQCTLHWGRMEYGNLGNYAIIEPLVRELHRTFSNAEIVTTFQMSDQFCQRERVQRLPMELYYGWAKMDFPRSLIEILSALTCRLLSFCPARTGFIREVMASDLVIDYSGDLWGENASLLGKKRFIIGILKDMTAYLLGKPVVLLAGSPGPFTRKWSQWLASAMLKRFALVTNREPCSTGLLRRDGLPMSGVQTLACPAFLFEGKSDQEMQQAFEKEGLLEKDAPRVGFVLCGWNMPIGPFNRSPREDSEFTVFAEAVEYLENELGLEVFLMSHNNAFTPPPDFRMFEGRDHETILQLKKVLDQRGLAKKVRMIKGVYDCGESKAIIRRFDMLVSGRIHAAVSGLTQHIPTVIIDYGHEPKAHKLRGFALVAGVSEYVADPANSDELKQILQACWTRRREIRENLARTIPAVQDLARRNFRLIREVMETRQNSPSTTKV